MGYSYEGVLRAMQRRGQNVEQVRPSALPPDHSTLGPFFSTQICYKEIFYLILCCHSLTAHCAQIIFCVMVDCEVIRCYVIVIRYVIRYVIVCLHKKAHQATS